MPSESADSSPELDQLDSDPLLFSPSDSDTVFPTTSTEILATKHIDEDVEILSNPPSQNASSAPTSVKKKKSKKPSDAKAASKSLMYNIAIIPASEVGKEKKKQAKVNTYMKLTSSDTISKYKHELLDKISTCLDKQDLNLGMFSVDFTIARISTAPLPVNSTEDYQNMIDHAVGACSDTITINLEVTEKVRPIEKKRKKSNRSDLSKSDSDRLESTRKSKKAKEVMDSDSDSDSEQSLPKDKRKKNKKASKKAKTKIPRASDLNPDDDPVRQQIQVLQNHWTCQKPGCASTGWCFINPEDNEHLALGMNHLNMWASALLKKDNTTATVDKPPNHRLFDALPAHVLGKPSLLQQRAREREASKENVPLAAAPLPPPIMNVWNLPTEIMRLTQGTTDATNSKTAGQVLEPEMLLLIGHTLGAQMTIAEFCNLYRLPTSVGELLTANNYTGSHTFGHISLDDLHSMGFKMGAIAEMRVAVKKWAASSK